MSKDFFHLFSRLMPLWVIIAGVVGFLYPPALVIFKSYVKWMFAATMLGIGAVLNFSDFKPVFRKPQDVFLGIFAQFLIMPLAGFLIGKILNLPAALLLGMVLVGSVPGAMASNVISYLARADVAYSIALTSTATLLAPVLTPTLTYIYAHTFIEIPFWKMFLDIVIMVIVPLFVGLGLKHFLRERIDEFSHIFPAFSTLFIAFICGLIVALNRQRILNLTLIIFIAVFLHNMVGLIFGYLSAKIYRFDIKRKRTLSIEVGMQNAGLGAVLALAHFSEQTALIPALFATWCVITASVLAEIWAER
jgi:BASS family bile acid:Na+ symporter